MTISKLDRGGKKRERKVFSASPKVALITLFFWIEYTVAINDLLCMKNAGAQIAMDFS